MILKNLIYLCSWVSLNDKIEYLCNALIMSLIQATYLLNYKSIVKLKILYVIVLLSLILSQKNYAQENTTTNRSGSTGSLKDSTFRLPVVDTFSKRDSTSKTKYKVSANAISSKILFHVPDSAILDNISKKSFFYGNDVTVEMDDIKLQSPYIVYDRDSSELHAFSLPDSVENSEALFSQGEESFGFEEIKYNFDSKRAVVRDAKSQYDDGYIYSDKIKRNNDNTIYGLENTYTTCSANDPHFSIVSQKIKIIPDRVVVSGPARLQIAGIPTPLIMPFALFPLSKGQKSGFILPNYDVSPQFGVGLRGMGYYLAISESMDLKLTGNLYSYGTWLASITSSYIKKYRYQGNFNIELGSTIYGDRNTESYSEDRTFRIGWNHKITPDIIRGYQFSALVNFVSPQFYRNNTYNDELFLQNSTNSNISLSKSWKGTPFNFSLNLTHDQNNATHAIDLTLPKFVFNMRQVSPFKRKIGSSNPKWFEKINLSYTMRVNNNMSFIDSLLEFSDPSTYSLQNAIQHQIPINANYKILKYFNFNANINYKEYWNTNKSVITLDETNNTLDTNIQNGFFTTRSIDGNVGLSTTIYGLFKFKSKKLQAIRHQMIPSISYVMIPNYYQSQWNTYYTTKLDTANEQESEVSYYINSLGNNYAQGGNQGALRFSLNNNFEMKIKDKKDSATYRKSTLIDLLNLSSGYNFIADSLKLSPLTLNFSTKILQQIVVQANFVFSPYSIDTSTGTTIDQFLWDAPGTSYLRMQSGSINISGGLDSKMFSAANNEEREEAINRYVYTDYLNQYVDFDIPWSIRLNYRHTLTNSYDVETKKWNLSQNPSLKLNGDFNLTPRWKFGYNVTYSFEQKKINYTQVDIYRDLHCWELRIGAIPYGFHRSFNLTLNVKAAVLQDLRINKRQDFIDNF